MRILITGGSGHIGRFVARQLRDECEVLLFDLVEAEPPFECVQGDLSVFDEVERACSDVDAIIHAGAIPYDSGEPRRIMEVNVMGTFNVLEAAAMCGVQKVVFASSLAARGGGPFSKEPVMPDCFPINENHPCRPDDTYGLSKLLGEQLCGAYTRKHGLTTICLRLAMVYDPKRSDGVERLNKIVNNPEYGRLFLWGYVDVRDVAQAFQLALENEAATHGVYHICAAEVAAEQTSLELIKGYYPQVPLINERSFVENPCRSLIDISKANKELGFQPQYSWRQSLSTPST